MSALATSLILHPALSQSLAVLATTLGRDKVGLVEISPQRLLHVVEFSRDFLVTCPSSANLVLFQVYRLVQYLARLIAWSLLRRGSVEAADRWDGLKNGLTMGRRGQWLSTY